jgi:hypothetical protein
VDAGRVQIATTPALDTLTVIATNTWRAVLLEELRAKHGIEIRASDVPNERITVRAVRVPLQEAIAQLLPAGSRYALRVGDRELTLAPGASGDKPGARDSRPDSLPTKDRTRPLPPEQRTAMKPGPDTLRVAPAREGPGLKPSADRVLDVPSGRGPKVALQIAAADSTVRLTFLMIAPDTVRLTGATLIEGATPRAETVEGPILFALRGPGGAVIYFGSVLDPLEEHAYLPDSTHTLGRAREGTFGISIPATVLARVQLAGVQLEFYDARAVTLPASLDERMFAQAIRGAKAIARIAGADLARALASGRPQ